MSQSRSVQYIGLGIYVLLESLIFLPIISLISLSDDGAQIFEQASIITLALFIGLTGIAFTSKKDFSFLRNIIIMGGVLSLALIIAGVIFGFNLGLWFSVGMVALASISILYQTQKLQFIYTRGQYVGASLQLFSSIMLLFWYVLRIVATNRK